MLVGLVLGRYNWVYLWFIKDCWVLPCLALFASIDNLFSVSLLLVLDFGLLVLLTGPHLWLWVFFSTLNRFCIPLCVCVKQIMVLVFGSSHCHLFLNFYSLNPLGE